MTFGRVGEKSRQVLALSTATIEAYDGAVRSSKTITSIYDFARGLRSSSVGEFAVVGRTERTAYRNIVEPMLQMFGKRHVTYNRGLGTLTIFGRKGYLIGANNEAARTKIQGLTLLFLYVDEAATIPESFFNMAFSRLSFEDSKMWLTANPEGRNHWLLINWLAKSRLWLKRDGTIVTDPASPIDLHRYTYTIDDNDYLPVKVKDRLKASYSGVWYLRFIMSEWTNAEGAIYDMWDPEVHTVLWADLPPMVRLFAVGSDYGTTNATTAELLGLGADGLLYIVDEWGHNSKTGQQRWTDAELSVGFRDWLGQAHTPHEFEPAIEHIILDPSAASYRQQLFRDGIRAELAKNDVVEGIKTVSSLLTTGLLKVARDRCPGVVNEFPGYVWDPKATELGEDKPLKGAGSEEHYLDGVRYAIYSTRQLWQPAMRRAA